MKKIFRMMDKPLFFSTLVMFIIGLIMIFSASYVKAYVSGGNTYQYFIKQSVILTLAGIMFLMVIKIPTAVYKKLAYPGIILLILSLIGLFFFGKEVKGVKGWYDLGFFDLQPSEFAKTIIIVFMGFFYNKNKNNKSDYKLVLEPILYVLFVCFLVFTQPDFGTMMIIFIISALTYMAVPIYPKLKNKINKIIVVGILLICTLMGFRLLNGDPIFTSAQQQRFSFLKPCDRYTEAGTGYQVCNGFIAINNGGLFGVGIGNSTQKYLYLPEAHTDFIFPVIIEELGLLFGVFLIIMCVFILYRIFYISKNSHNLMNSIISYGIGIYIFSHLFINLVGVLGVLPLTGVPFPFLSYGGSYSLNLALSIAIVERIAIENYIAKNKEKLSNM